MRPDLPRHIAATIERFTGRVWVLDAINEWLGDESRRTLLITGEPGSGKSSIAAWLAGSGPLPLDPIRREQLAKIRRATRAIHFCIAETGSTSARACAEHLAAQLQATVPGFGRAVERGLRDTIQITGEAQADTVSDGSVVAGVYVNALSLAGLSDETAFDRAVRDPLKRLRPDEIEGTVVLVVDALDEAITRAQGTPEANLVHLLAGLDDLPPIIRLLATSRPDPRVLKYYRQAARLDLIRGAPRDIDDVRAFVYSSLRDLPEEAQDRLSSRIAAAADGNFLHASLIVQDLHGKSSQELDSAALDLPSGLPDIYCRFLLRELGTDEAKWQLWFKPVLGLLCVGQGDGLTRDCLNAILGKDVEGTLRTCKQYLDGELRDGPFRPFHRSFTEFLLNEKGNLDFKIDAREMHNLLADHYWKYQPDWRDCDSYGIRYLAIHLYEAGNIDRLSKLISREWIQLRLEHGGGSYVDLIQDVALVWQGLEQEDSRQIARGRSAWTIGQQVRCAFCFSNVASLASEMRPWDIAAFVRDRQWTPRQGLAHAERIYEPQARLDALLLLASEIPELREQVLERALRSAQAIDPAGNRVSGIGQLLPYLSGCLRTEAICKAIEALCELSDTKLERGHIVPYLGYSVEPVYTGDRTQKIAEFSGLVFGEDVSALEELTRICGLEDAARRHEAASALATRLGKPGAGRPTLPGGLGSVPEQDRPHRQVDRPLQVVVALARLQLYLVEAATPSQATTILGDDYSQLRSRAVAQLARVLPCELAGADRKADFQEMLTAGDQRTRSENILASASLLPELCLRQAIVSLGDLETIKESRDALLALAPRLDRQLLTLALEMCLAIGHGATRVDLIVGLAPYLGELIGTALTGVGAFRDVQQVIGCLAGLAPFLTQPTLPQALSIARSLEEDWYRRKALAVILLRIPEGLMPDIRPVLTEIGFEAYLAEAEGTGAMPRLSPSLLTEALEWLKTTGGCRNIRLLALLVPCIQREHLDNALETIDRLGVSSGIPRPDIAVQAFAELAPRLIEWKEFELVNRLLERYTGWARYFYADLDLRVFVSAIKLAAFLPLPEREQLLESVVDRADKVVSGRGYDSWNQGTRAGLLAKLLPYLPEPHRKRAAKAALENQRKLHTTFPDQLSSDFLIDLARALPSELLPEAELLNKSNLLPMNLPPALLAEALWVARDRKNIEWLLAIAERAPGDMLASVFEAADEMGGPLLRTKVACQVAERIAGLPRETAFRLWHTTLHSMGNLRVEAFLEYLTKFPILILALGGKDALTSVMTSIRDEAAFWQDEQHREHVMCSPAVV